MIVNYIKPTFTMIFCVFDIKKKSVWMCRCKKAW